MRITVTRPEPAITRVRESHRTGGQPRRQRPGQGTPAAPAARRPGTRLGASGGHIDTYA